MNYEHFFLSYLQRLQEEGRYRIFADLERPVGMAPCAYWHHNGRREKVTIWCSNDYLGMSHHPEVIAAALKGIQDYGVGSGGTRNISGTAHPHVLLEQDVAQFHGKERALIFSSGYTANEAALSSLLRHIPDIIVLSDEKNHASVIQGILHSGASKLIFKHNNLEDLEAKLAQLPHSQPKLIVVTSVYSMSGDIAPLKAICALAKQHNALTYVDEVHAVGMYGETGAGITERDGLQQDVDIIQGNFAKGFGVVGGYIAASTALIDFVRSTASGFIFTTSMPPAIAIAASQSLRVVARGQSIRQSFWQNVHYFKEKLAATGLVYEANDSHIIAIKIGDARVCRAISDHLLHHDKIYIQPINYPTVPVGQERLRITVTPDHTHKHIDELIAALGRVCGQRAAMLAA